MLYEINEEVEKFIFEHEHEDINKLALYLKGIPNFTKTFFLNQIKGRQIAKKKLPTFYKNHKIVYPYKVSLEQSSSEKTASFKAGLIEGNTLADLTGGFGIDTYFFSEKAKEVIYVEPNQELFEIVKNNFLKVFGKNNIRLCNERAEPFLESLNRKFDIIYLDPSRRNNNKRFFKLDKYDPNIIEILPLLFQKSKEVVVKISTMLDIKRAITDLENKVYKVAVLQSDNECKEVLLFLKEGEYLDPIIQCFNLDKKEPYLNRFEFRFSEEKEATAQFSKAIEKYIFIPSAAIMKAGAFKLLTKKYDVKKLHPNSHVYTSDEVISDFPGKSYLVQNVLDYKPKKLKRLFDEYSARVIVLNFPIKAAELREKLGISSGETKILICTTDFNENKKVIEVSPF